jgi:hypothetical protein
MAEKDGWLSIASRHENASEGICANTSGIAEGTTATCVEVPRLRSVGRELSLVQEWWTS